MTGALSFWFYAKVEAGREQQQAHEVPRRAGRHTKGRGCPARGKESDEEEKIIIDDSKVKETKKKNNNGTKKQTKKTTTKSKKEGK